MPERISCPSTRLGYDCPARCPAEGSNRAVEPNVPHELHLAQQVIGQNCDRWDRLEHRQHYGQHDRLRRATPGPPTATPGPSALLPMLGHDETSLGLGIVALRRAGASRPSSAFLLRSRTIGAGRDSSGPNPGCSAQSAAGGASAASPAGREDPQEGLPALRARGAWTLAAASLPAANAGKPGPHKGPALTEGPALCAERATFSTGTTSRSWTSRYPRATRFWM
jgi:hypothetical protein